jgi:hypothetical protein
MTTVRIPVPAMRLVFLTALVFLAGCGESVTSYRIEGAKGDFCVSDSLDATPARPRSDTAYTGGFTLNGCWGSDGVACKGPESVVSMAVVPQKYHSGWRFFDFGSGAHFSDVAVSHGAHARVLADNLIAIPERPGTETWYIWRLVEMPHTGVRGNDELMSVCDASPEHGGYSCDRRVTGPDYAVIYSYIASGNLPTTFDALDKRILGDVETLRCKRTP